MIWPSLPVCCLTLYCLCISFLHRMCLKTAIRNNRCCNKIVTYWALHWVLLRLCYFDHNFIGWYLILQARRHLKALWLQNRLNKGLFIRTASPQGKKLRYLLKQPALICKISSHILALYAGRKDEIAHINHVYFTYAIKPRIFYPIF